MVKKGSTVLIVDDQGELRSMVKKMLRQMDLFEFYVEARDGEDAWEKLTTSPVDLVICDVDMPRLDGMGLMKRCQGDPALREVPFLIISGDRQQGAVAVAAELGAYSYVVKPFSFLTLRDRVEEVFERLNSPEHSRFRAARRLKELGQLEQALEVIAAMEKSGQPLKGKWTNLKGEIYRDMNQLDRAAECFEKTIQRSMLFLAGYKNYASIQQELGHRDKAIDALLKADEINPRDTERKFSLGKMLLEEGQIEEGKAFLDQAIRQSSPEERQMTQIKAAEVLLEAECFEDAEKLYSSSLQASPEDLQLYNRLGIALRRQGKYAEAVRYYNQALSIHPDNPIIYYNLGVLYAQAKDRYRAIEFLKWAIKISPNFKEAQQALAQIQGGE
jgi:tetratricopeptide (TPR) repeat protein